MGQTARTAWTAKRPIRGVDYWTEDDVSAMWEYIDGRLGVVENGTY